MPMGPGTYGSKVGRPPKKKKKAMPVKRSRGTITMPMGPGTYGSKVGRPPKKKKKAMPVKRSRGTGSRRG
jgi:hypothetical protein